MEAAVSDRQESGYVQSYIHITPYMHTCTHLNAALLAKFLEDCSTTFEHNVNGICMGTDMFAIPRWMQQPQIFGDAVSPLHPTARLCIPKPATDIYPSTHTLQ